MQQSVECECLTPTHEHTTLLCVTPPPVEMAEGPQGRRGGHWGRGALEGGFREGRWGGGGAPEGRFGGEGSRWGGGGVGDKLLLPPLALPLG